MPLIHHLPQGQWALLAPSMLGYGYRHHWSYSLESAKRWNAAADMVGVFDDDGDCLAMAAVRTVALPLKVGGIAYVSGGPLTRPDLSVDELKTSIQALVQQFVQRHKVVLRIAPPVEWALAGYDIEQILVDVGFRPTATQRPYRTLVLDLSRPLDGIEAQLHPKWRAGLRRARAADLTIRRDSSDELFGEFQRLHEDLIVRKGFTAPLGTEFYREVNQQAAENERFTVTIAYSDGIAVAGHLGSSLGETCVYILGASSPDGNLVNASFLLQWATIEHAKAQGLQWYDLGGIDPEDNPGVYRFKSRMGGVDVTVPGPYDFTPSRSRGLVVRAGESTARLLRRS
jgi:hypothetical protein